MAAEAGVGVRNGGRRLLGHLFWKDAKALTGDPGESLDGGESLQMVNRVRQTLWSVIVAMVVLVGVSEGGSAQVLHRSGQSIQPVFEGFEKNPDGSYTMWFGYLNRNYDEEPHVPIGADNYFVVAEEVTRAGPVDVENILRDPGPIDRGQPTHFYPRRQMFVFGVALPADFGGKNLVWTLNHQRMTYVAIGTLDPEWVWAVDEGVWQSNRGTGLGGRTEIAYTNQPPAIRVVGDAEVSTTVGYPVTLSFFASDDGRPGPRPPPQEGQGRNTFGSAERGPLPNALPSSGGGMGANGPKAQSIPRSSDAGDTGLAVTWVHYRGPGVVKFDPMVMPLSPEGVEAMTSVRFSEPGTYVVRAYADDRNFTRSADVTVVVKAASSQN